MTCVAFDGKTVAADKRLAIHGVNHVVTKIFKLKDCIVAFAGNIADGMAMLNWIKHGRIPENFPFTEQSRDDWSRTLVFSKAEGIQVYEYNRYPYKIETRQCAIGHGCDFALASMFLGHTAVEAVEVACHFDSTCGNGIDAIDIWW